MTRITVAKGDGIGPEIMDATLDVLKAAGAELQIEEIEVGEKVYLSGNTSGIAAESWETIRRNKIFLKAPITTPQGGGYKSLNVTTRKSMGLYANVRPCMSLHPFVSTKHPVMDLVIIRENEEDLYAGIEHQQTDEVIQCLKLISRPGCEKIIRYAFEYTKQQGRKKVTCLTKDNIMKQTDGLFHKIFDEIALDYPEIQTDHWIIDIGAAKLAQSPQDFDVIVTLNLYGDIISDIAAEIAGSVGLGGSANIGETCAMFEAIHGSAPMIAGQNIGNPSGLIQAAVMMLNHIGQTAVAHKIQNAWLKTIEDGIHTKDIYKPGFSKKEVSTTEFAAAVIANLGKEPTSLKAVASFNHAALSLPKYVRKPAASKKLVGVDLFVHWTGTNPDELAKNLQSIQKDGVALSMITNRGVKVWPNGFEETFCTDHWRCRFTSAAANELSKADIIELLQAAANFNIDVVKTEIFMSLMESRILFGSGAINLPYMVNVIIYLETKNDAEELVKYLLSIQLIASAAIDKDNISYAMNDGLLVKNVFNVITAKTKSLLINDIIKAVEDEIGEEVLIISTPIVGSNHNFDALVKQNTRPV